LNIIVNYIQGTWNNNNYSALICVYDRIETDNIKRGLRNGMFVIHLRGEVFKCAACMWLEQPCLHISLTHHVLVEFSLSFLVYGGNVRVVQHWVDWRWYIRTIRMSSNSSIMSLLFNYKGPAFLPEYVMPTFLFLLWHIKSTLLGKEILGSLILFCNYYLRNCTHTQPHALTRHKKRYS
jgi:hypothetical protein